MIILIENVIVPRDETLKELALRQDEHLMLANNLLPSGKWPFWIVIVHTSNFIEERASKHHSLGGNDGTFEIVDPKRFAQMWAEKTGSTNTANFENIERSLRTCNTENIFATVDKLRQCRFCIDIKSLTDFSSVEIKNCLN